tara:strand:- start:400 stop:642 length:243 start_codon:yes stop_codon:yes gene_type:complete
MSEIIMYGTTWCADCRVAKRFFEDNKVQYKWINIDEETEFVECVLQINDGLRIVPTIVFPDGSHMSEPTYLELEDKIKGS